MRRQRQRWMKSSEAMELNWNNYIQLMDFNRHPQFPILCLVEQSVKFLGQFTQELGSFG